MTRIIKFILGFFMEFLARFMFDQKHLKLERELAKAENKLKKAESNANEKIRTYKDLKRTYDASKLRKFNKVISITRPKSTNDSK